MKDTKTCINGHKLTGVGFDDFCPECEEPWIKETKVDWEVEFRQTFAEYATHKRLDQPAFIIWAIEFIQKLLDETKQETLLAEDLTNTIIQGIVQEAKQQVLVALLADMESCATAKECRHLLKELLLSK